MNPTTCADCGGPTRQAFDNTTEYVSCRRCGHVFPSILTGAAAQDAIKTALMTNGD